MRILFLPLMFGLFSWCSIVIYGLGDYLDPIPKLYEVYCVACFHHLMISVLHPDENTRKELFIQTERLDRKNKRHKHDSGSYRWYRVQSMFVHNTLFAILVLTIVEEVLVYQECKTNGTSRVVSAIITLLTTVFTIMAIVSLLRIYTRFKAQYQETRILRRFWVRLQQTLRTRPMMLTCPDTLDYQRLRIPIPRPIHHHRHPESHQRCLADRAHDHVRLRIRPLRIPPLRRRLPLLHPLSLVTFSTAISRGASACTSQGGAHRIWPRRWCLQVLLHVLISQRSLCWLWTCLADAFQVAAWPEAI